ncbi:uncharacterized protein [Triticum aestivum]|uniref:uncharacterized protein n=1 Tax=Triticum aestivum TaxID=4565 RepID=UPI0008459B89|nr:uncharacterized protein LOC123186490 [Triticum aestivum]
MDPLPPLSSYRESIRSVVVWPGWGISPQSGQSGSNYSSNSGASSSYMSSNYSVCSSGSAFAAQADLSASELTKIAQRMVSDGYVMHIFQSFIDSSSSPIVRYGGRYSLENWFVELDVDWVLQIRENNGDYCEWRFQFRGVSASRLQELVERWSPAMTIIVVSFRELVATIHDAPAVAQFGKASISPMLAFIDAVIHANEAEKLQAMLHTYFCVSNASYNMSLMHLISSEAQRIFNEICASLDRESVRVLSNIIVQGRLQLDLILDCV